MLCDHQLISEHLVDFIDNKLSPKVRQQFENNLDYCESCRSVYQQALALEQASHQWQNQAVPQWHRTEYAVRPRQKNKNWLNWTALLTSTMAILMVVFQVQFTRNENGFQIAFGNHSNQQVNQLIEKRLNKYKKQQSILLDARFVAQANQQETTNKLMLVEIMDKTRNERRDDLNFLITGIQTQRFEDQQKVDKDLTYLAENQIENNQYINQLIQSANLNNKGDNQ